jgi:hypothetical protein
MRHLLDMQTRVNALFHHHHCITMKRKRNGHSDDAHEPNKKCHRETRQVTHPVLEKYYHSVTSLREYLLAALPSASKHRRQILKRRVDKSLAAKDIPDTSSCAYALLDDVFVCSTKTAGGAVASIEPADRLHFSQQYAVSSGGTPGKTQGPSQAEVLVSQSLNCAMLDTDNPVSL